MTFKSPKPNWIIPPAQMNSVAISDDGELCVYGSSYERGQGFFHTQLANSQGDVLWKQAVIRNQKTYQGVYWVDISGDGSMVASGGETVDYHQDPSSTEPGFLQAFLATTGETVLNITKPSRINQVSLSQDGKYLAVCYGKTVEVLMLTKTLITPGLYQYKYNSIYTYKSNNFTMNNCAISRNGTMVVASGIAWSDGNDRSQTNAGEDPTVTTTGQVYSFELNAGSGTVSQPKKCPTSTGCMRVGVTENGQYWAASLHDGSCLLISNSSPTSMLWSHTATPAQGYTLKLAYAIDVTETDTNEVYVACGANLSGGTNGGLLYLIKNTATATTNTPTPQWQTELEFGVNPGVSMDKNATYVTAADGKPDGQSTTESAGNLYMFKVSDGSPVIHQPTSMMNWPMQISRDASSVIGASDDGAVYFWKAPYTQPTQ